MIIYTYTYMYRLDRLDDACKYWNKSILDFFWPPVGNTSFAHATDMACHG